MNIALLLIYLMSSMSLGVVMAKHGQPQDDYNVWISLISTLISLVLIWWALGWQFI